MDGFLGTIPFLISCLSRQQVKWVCVSSGSLQGDWLGPQKLSESSGYGWPLDYGLAGLAWEISFETPGHISARRLRGVS